MIDTGKTIFVAQTKNNQEMMRRSLLLASVLYMMSLGVQAQTNDKWAGGGLDVNIIGGKVVKHTAKFRADVPDHSGGFELNYVRQTDGRKDWQQRRRYPLVGFGFAYTNYGMDSIYGKCLSIYPNLQIPVIRAGNFEWTFKAGFGLGYATKRFERFGSWDTLNTAIGSHFNNYSYFATDFRYHVNNNLDIQAGFNFSHMSNAAFRQPNLGINMYGAHIGARYYPVTSRPERISTALTPLKNRWLGQIRLGISGTELSVADGPLYPVYLVSAYASKRYLSKNKAFAGIDYSYHEHIYAFQRNNEINVGNEKANSWKGSIFFGNEFLYGRVGIMLQVGIYYKQAVLAGDPYYEKLGGNFYIIQSETGILKELFASVLLKTHQTQAELVELGIGASF
ncbi:acyloxyacyl hydrolase [Polluticoccus soli]|uniref:acyloxyacyl hydrolase n=1 Tax=Polluticoccus soli TaxID=3034150 RepID=UPI0023E2B062|nr:acyloxyacyl hydrolase [Flavipsychrobacter sp. JY13-12]